MRETVTITLTKPLKAHGGVTISEIVLREPTFDEYLAHGDPFMIAMSQSGSPFAVENADTIQKYIRLCVIEPKDPALLSQAGARVAKQVKETILGFFQPDIPKDEA